MARYKVVGVCEVGGVAPGGTVELDEETVNVAALLAAGHVKPYAPKAKPKPEGDD